MTGSQGASAPTLLQTQIAAGQQTASLSEIGLINLDIYNAEYKSSTKSWGLRPQRQGRISTGCPAKARFRPVLLRVQAAISAWLIQQTAATYLRVKKVVQKLRSVVTDTYPMLDVHKSVVTTRPNLPSTCRTPNNICSKIHVPEVHSSASSADRLQNPYHIHVASKNAASKPKHSGYGAAYSYSHLHRHARHVTHDRGSIRNFP